MPIPYIRALDLPHAIHCVQQGMLLIAGGTILSPALAALTQVPPPKGVVDIGWIDVLRTFQVGSTEAKIGATVSLTTIANDLRLPDALRVSAGSVGNPNIRNAGTLGGNIAASEDLKTALCVLDAEVACMSGNSLRKCAISEFKLAEEEEIITAIHVPLLGRNSGFVKCSLRGTSANSLVTVAASVSANGDLAPRIAIGGIACPPHRLTKSEETLQEFYPKIGWFKKVASTFTAEVRFATIAQSPDSYLKKAGLNALEVVLGGLLK